MNTVRRVFVSHSSSDTYFVNLLMEILDFHGVRAWCSSRDIAPGRKFRDEIDTWLRKAEILLVVVSAHAKQSKWMTKEIATFQSVQADGLVIPLRLDDTDPNQLIDQLHGYEAISFANDMRAGFQSLLAIFGKDFLPRADRRSGSRRTKERRSGADRQHSSITQRLRLGFWKQYVESVGISKFEEVALSRSELYRAVSVLTPVALKHTYTNQEGKLTPPREALEGSANEIWEEWRPREPVKVIYVIEAIAERLTERFEVSRIDRRNSARRGQSNERREEPVAKSNRR